jgi:hypothetical protein
MHSHQRRRSGHVASSIVLGMLALIASPASAQPTQEQINAVRQSCRSDYMSYCKSVTPGGPEALQCLRSNSGKLSAGCRRAVDAIAARPAPAAPAAAPKQAPAPAPVAVPSAPPPEAPPAAVETAAPPPAEAPPAAAPPPSRPTPKAAAKPAPEKPAPRVKAAAPPVVAAPPPPGEPAVATPMPPLPLRARLQVLRICDVEQRTLCGRVPPGGNRIVDCLAANEPSLSPRCRGALARARQF